MILQNNTRTHLQPALLPFGCYASLPVQPGSYKCSIHVEQGDILLRHGSYNLETGAWEDEPQKTDIDQVLIREGETRDLHFTCEDHYGQPDNIWIYNNSYLKSADFTCSFEKNKGALPC